MNVNRLIGRALIAGIAMSAIGLGSAAVGQALPPGGTDAQDCFYNGMSYPSGSAHPNMTDTFCDNGVWKTSMTGPEAPTPARKNVFVPKLGGLTASVR